MVWWVLLVVLGVVVVGLVVLAVHDLVQRKHAILRNFPVIGHFRYLLESVGPELRQYIVTDNNSERPFSRDQRRWVYASAKRQINLFGFGTDNDLELSPNFLIVKHATFPVEEVPAERDRLPCGKVLGASHARTKAFRMASAINVSGMSFGTLSGPAVEAMNRGASGAGCLHNTGEGGITEYHRKGGQLVWQI